MPGRTDYLVELRGFEPMAIAGAGRSQAIEADSHPSSRRSLSVRSIATAVLPDSLGPIPPDKRHVPRGRPVAGVVRLSRLFSGRSSPDLAPLGIAACPGSSAVRMNC